jgi:hypothetical protein
MRFWTKFAENDEYSGYACGERAATMTGHGDPGHGAMAAMTIPLSEADWHALHEDDILSAKVVVGLMMGIFTTGLVLYSIVLTVVAH